MADQAEGVGETLADRKLIRRAEMRMEVADYDQALAQVRALAERHQAEITKEEESQYGQRLQNQMTLRMPPSQLDSLVGQLAQLATYIDSRSVEAEDVTREYIDLESRLESKRAVLKRYRELLKEANDVQEVLAVEEQLRQLVEEIESTEAQFRYIKRQVDRSTLQLTIYETTKAGIAKRSFVSRVGQALSGGWQLLQHIVIGLVAAWPVLLLLGGLLFWWLRRRRRRR